MYDRLTRILIPFVYFIAGATTLAGVAATFYYKEDLGLSIVQTQFLGSIAIIPWSIKPLYGLLSDRVPVFGKRRKPYLFLAGLLSSIGYFSLALWVHSFTGAVIAVILYGIGFALADVIVDGIVAEMSHSQKEAGKLQSICRAALFTGALIVAYLSGILVESIGPRNVFLITAFLPLLTSVFALCMKEEQTEVATASFKETWQKIKEAVNRDLLWACLFLFIWRATPSSGGALNYYVIDELGFTPEFFGRLTVISRIMSIVGVLIFRKWLIAVSLKKLFVWIIFLSVILSLPSIGLVYGWYEVLGISPQLFAVADEFVSAPLSEIAFIPLMVLVTRICPKGIEATMFALLASLMNIGLAVSDMGGAFLVKLFDVHQATETLSANYEHIDKVLWIAILSSFLPLPFIGKLPNIRAKDEGTGPSAMENPTQPLEAKSDAVV